MSAAGLSAERGVGQGTEQGTGQGADPPGSEPVFIHSMFRTGSTYLAARVREVPGYRFFYEPFHAGIGRPGGRAPGTGAVTPDDARRILQHEALEGGYFAGYDDLVPGTGRPLRQLARARFGVHDVYNGLHPGAERYLKACLNVAAASERRAAFGFCRSGLQVAEMRRLGGLHVHLYRDPRFQFRSYSTRQSRFFMAATILQLLCSREHGGRVARWVGLPAPAAHAVRLAGRGLVPNRIVARIGRDLLARLDGDARYRVFYLAWSLCRRHADEHAAMSFTLMDAIADSSTREKVEAQLGIQLVDLRPLDEGEPLDGVGYDVVEREVEAVLS